MRAASAGAGNLPGRSHSKLRQHFHDAGAEPAGAEEGAGGIVGIGRIEADLRHAHLAKPRHGLGHQLPADAFVAVALFDPEVVEEAEALDTIDRDLVGDGADDEAYQLPRT